MTGISSCQTRTSCVRGTPGNRAVSGDNAGVSTRSGSDDARRLLVRLVVVSLVATAGAAIVALLAGEFGDTQLRVILTTGAVSLYGLMALPAGVLLEQRRLTALAQV